MKELLEQLKELIINKEYSKIKLMLEITDKYIKDVDSITETKKKEILNV